jgi:DNA polymerase-3 subunit delta
MIEMPPPIYLLYGDHEMAFSDFIARLREKMGDSSTADMNIDYFSAGKFELGKLEEVILSLPFLTRRRLVIVEQSTELLSRESAKDHFYRILKSVPDTTALLLIEKVDFNVTKGRIPKILSELIHWLEDNQPSAYIKRFDIPHGPQFVQWIRQRTHELGGEMDPRAAYLLSELVAEDPHLAHQEIVKLLDFVNYERPVETEDVEELTPFHRESDVFAMVDAIGLRNGSQALRQLRSLLEDEPALYAFSMVIRQFRLLLLAKEAQYNHQDPKDVLKVHPFVAGKIITQSQNFSLEDLERIYHHLMQIDVDSKTGKDDLEVSLESFVALLTQ